MGFFTILKGILDKIPGWLWAIALASALALSATYKIQSSGFELDLAKLTATVEKERADAKQAAFEASEKYRIAESAWGVNKKEIEDEHKIEITAIKATSDRFSRDNARLRGSIAQYASGSAAAEDTLPACRVRAATLGDVLADSLRIQEQLAAEAESRLADARSLQTWGQVIEKAIK